MEPGFYDARVIGAMLTTARSGSPGVLVTVEIEQPEGVFRMDGTIWMTEKAMRMARAQLKAIGFDPDAHDDLGKIGEIVAGRTCQVKIVQEEYQGRTTTKINYFGQPAQAPSVEAVARALAGLRAAKGKDEPMSQTLPPRREPPLEEPPPSVAGSNIGKPPPEEDDIPF